MLFMINTEHQVKKKKKKKAYFSLKVGLNSRVCDFGHVSASLKHQLLTFIFKGHFGLVVEANVHLDQRKSRNLIGWLGKSSDG